MKARIPHISTRNYYDLRTGAKLRTGTGYSVYPRNYLETHSAPRELVIVVHGMQNDRAGAAQKFAIAQRRLRRLGYGMPVIGYTYDANVRGAHSQRTQARALCTALKIATGNGGHLAAAISDIRRIWPATRIRLIGHSLGSIVIASALQRLASKGAGANAVEGVYLFGASLPLKSAASPRMRRALGRVVRRRVLNYYCPEDDVLQHASETRQIGSPIGLGGIASGRFRPPHYAQRRVRPRNHRFAMYAATLRSFP